MALPLECAEGVESDDCSTAAGEGFGEDSPAPTTPARPSPHRRDSPCLAPGRTLPVGHSAPPRAADATPESFAGQTPASSSDSQPSSVQGVQSPPVRAPPGLARPEPLCWSPFLGNLEEDAPAPYAPANAFSETRDFGEVPGSGDGKATGAHAELPLLLGNKTEPYYDPSEMVKTSLIGTPAAYCDASPLMDSPGLPLPVGAVQGGAELGDATRAALADERLGMELGSEAIPTVGSAGHYLRACKPCAFVNTKGCKDGVGCKFCHLCEPGEKKRRKKEKNAFRRAVNRWQRGGMQPGGAGPWDTASLQLPT